MFMYWIQFMFSHLGPFTEILTCENLIMQVSFFIVNLYYFKRVWIFLKSIIYLIDNLQNIMVSQTLTCVCIVVEILFYIKNVNAF